MTALGETTGHLSIRDPDVRLMVQVRDDVPGAFEQLVDRYQQRLVGVLTHIVGRADEAEDLAQEVFLRMYRSRMKYRAKSKFSTWLFTIANNLALNAIRSRKRKQTVSLNTRDSGPLGPRPQEQLVHDSTTVPTKRVQNEELAGIVRRAIDGLNERQRVAVILNKFEEMGYAEIAEVMGLTPKAVKSLLSRARENLRVVLQDYIYMDGQPVPAGDVNDI